MFEHRRTIDCSRTRLVYVDLGVNWANTLRLYKDFGTCADATHWEVYGFEANPYIQTYANHFVEFLNGQVPMPPKDVPPTGSSEDLHLFARKYNCSMHRALSRAFKTCMWDHLETQLMNVRTNPRLGDPRLLSDRLGAATFSNVGARYPRYVLVPAAAGGKAQAITIEFSRIQLVRGGSITSAWHRVQTDQTAAWRAMLVNVTQVDVAAWLTSHFKEEDYVIVKADIEGAEHGLFRKLLLNQKEKKSCVIDVLAWQCHGGPTNGDCARLTKLIHSRCPSTIITEEGKGPYNGIDKATRAELIGLV